MSERALPRSVCEAYKDAIDRVDRRQLCGDRPVSVFVYRDWWSLRNKRQGDVQELAQKVARGALPTPDAR